MKQNEDLIEDNWNLAFNRKIVNKYKISLMLKERLFKKLVDL